MKKSKTYTLGLEGERNWKGSLTEVWRPDSDEPMRRGVDADYYIGIIAQEGAVSAESKLDAADEKADVIDISDVAIRSELGDALNDIGGTNTTAVYVRGLTERTAVEMTRTDIIMSDRSDGKNANDFTGLGIAVVAEGTKAELVIRDSSIHTSGFGRDGLLVSGGATVLVENSSIYAEGANIWDAYDGYASNAAQTFMLSPPWVIGIYGATRGINVIGPHSVLTLADSKVQADSWSVVSVDSCNSPTVNVINTDLTATPYDAGKSTTMNAGSELFGYDTVYGSAYGIYNVTHTHEFFYGANVSGTTYAAVLTSGEEIYYGASRDGLTVKNAAEEKEVYTYRGEGRDTVVNSIFGLMNHQSIEHATLDEGSVWNTEEAVIVTRGPQNSSYVISGAVLNPGNGIILQMADNDDGYGTSGSGGDTDGSDGFFRWTGEPWGLPVFSSGFSDEQIGFTAPSEGGGFHTTLTLKPGSAGTATYRGNIFNGTGTYKGAVTGGLKVMIEKGVTLEGSISSTSAIHGLPYRPDAVEYLDALAEKYGDGVAPDGGDAYTVKYTLLDAEGNVTEDGDSAKWIQLNEFTMYEYYCISHVINKPMPGANLSLTIGEGATWVVTGDSYITELNNTGTICDADGNTVTVITDGETTVEGTGRYTVYVTTNEGGDDSMTLKDVAAWTIGGNYRIYLNQGTIITIGDCSDYKYVGSDTPVNGVAVIDNNTNPGLMYGWLVVNEDGSMAITKEHA